MSEPERRTARILIALSATAETRIELEAYRYLLDDAAPELVGLVVEDPALVAHAGSRLAREIVLSGLERRLEREALERQLRSRVAAWRRLLEAESARLGLTILLETVREERRAALARAAERADALIVERDAHAEALELWSALPRAAPLRALMLTPARRPAGEIVVVAGETESREALDAALAAAGRVAAATGARIAVLGVGQAPAAAAAAALRIRGLGLRPSGYAALAGPAATPRQVAAHAAHASLVVLPAGASRDAELVREISARVRGALMLLRRRDDRR